MSTGVAISRFAMCFSPPGWALVHVTISTWPRSNLASGFRHLTCHDTHACRIPDPRFSDARCALLPNLSPFWLHTGPCDQLSCDRYHTTRRGFGIYKNNVHTFLGAAICRFPISSVHLTPVLHLLLDGPQLIPLIGKSRIAISRCMMFKVFCQYQNPNPETPMPPVLCAGCATCHLADLVCWRRSTV